ncbi:MAG: metallophosphatase family protein [Bacteroidetes bacterium]|jgi:diadenosine tetraphosphatase ApaH/serine/threonine PP2A family protein phosphatase|nr:metallophosphatase family protein [Bacteroidota bacterium]
MRTAIISDIHGNLEALEAVLASIRSEGMDRIICLGDIVGYGADPGPCIDLVRSACAFAVLGNHDAAAVDISLAERFSSHAAAAIIWTGTKLSAEHLQYLRGLPLLHAESDRLYVHASPLEPALWNYVFDSIDAREALTEVDRGVCFIGHTHTPALFRDRKAAGPLRREESAIINVGSVGQPRDGAPEASYGTFDDDAWSYRNVRVPYDIDTAAKKIRESGLPSRLADRLFVGR